MIKNPQTRFQTPPLGNWAIAAALACAAGASQAGVATLSIDGFIVSTSAIDTYVSVAASSQNHAASAKTAGGVGGSAADSYAANDWAQGNNISAVTGYASATALLTLFTDPNTALGTAGFNLSASTIWGGNFPSPALPHEANARSSLFGSFGLVDAAGAAAAGDITFAVYYTMEVNTPNGNPVSDYSQVLLGLSASDADETYAPASVGLLSTDYLGGASGSQSGFFAWTFNLASGQLASFNMTGSAISLNSVPEPSALALVALALGGLSLTRRGARSKVDAGLAPA